MTTDRSHNPSICELQEAQAEFDRGRGFDFDAKNRSEVERLSFAGLALCGEVGELANALKKAQRARWLGEDPAAYLKQAADELGDVLAYLLKTATLLGADLTDVYLTTMSDNCLRFPPRTSSRARLITIAGPSGSGKTTVARALSSDFEAFVEDVIDNPHLDPLLTNVGVFDAHANQRWFLGRVEAFVRAANPEVTVVLDQDPAAIVRAYARLFRDEEQLPPAAYRSLLLDLLHLEQLLARWGGGRTVVFLDASAATLRARVQHRGDPALPPEKWFDSVREYFATLRAHVPTAHFIDTSDLDADEVVEHVRNLVSG